MWMEGMTVLLEGGGDCVLWYGWRDDWWMEGMTVLWCGGRG